MNVLRSGLVTMLLLAAFSVQAACTWPAWEQFKKDYISQEGRVIDPSDARKITTSEGQSYGMFFLARGALYASFLCHSGGTVRLCDDARYPAILWPAADRRVQK